MYRDGLRRYSSSASPRRIEREGEARLGHGEAGLGIVGPDALRSWNVGAFPLFTVRAAPEILRR